MKKQKKIQKNRKGDLCIICKTNPKREKAKTCNQSCAGKLAWETRLSQ